MIARRYRLDGGAGRHGTIVVGGSPLRLFRLTVAGRRLVDRIAIGEPVPRSTLVDALLDAGAIHPDVSDHDSPFSAEDVTIVVPTVGAPAHVPDGALVVDDGSIPPVEGASVRLPTNAGPAAARNAGLQLVSTPLVAFVDSDIELSDGWLDPLLAHFADARVAMVAPRVMTAPGTSTVARYESRHSPLDLGNSPARVRAGTRVSYVPAATIVVRTEVVRELGGFDTALRYGEDVDFVWRLDAAGWWARYEPTSVVRHASRPDWGALVRQRIGYGSSAAPLACRHPGALSPLRVSGWSLSAWLLGVARRPWLGLAVGLGSAAALVVKLPDLPPRTAFRIAAIGNLRAGQQIAHAIRRVWWPVLIVAAARSSVARRALVAAALAAQHPVVLVDDVAYSIGVWRGILRERTLDPIIPRVTSWPGRSARSGRIGAPSSSVAAPPERDTAAR